MSTIKNIYSFHSVLFSGIILLHLMFPICLTAGSINRGDDINISLPESYGSIKESFAPEGHTASVIYIQDSHTSISAQKNLSNIIRLLTTKYGISSVYIEGASSSVDTSELSIFPDTSVKKTVADYCVKRGYIDGAEYVSILENSEAGNEFITIRGIETRNLYMQNVHAFLRAEKISAGLSEFTDHLREIIILLKKHIYSKELQVFDTSISAFHTNQQSFDLYCNLLRNFADNNLLHYEHLTQFIAFIELMQAEKQIDFNRADVERQQAVRSLTSMLSKDEAHDLLRKEFDYKTNTISLSEYSAYFRFVCGQNDFNVQAFPELTKLLNYISVYQTLVQDKVISEAESLEKLIFAQLIDNADEQMLYDISEFTRILSKLEHFHLSETMYNQYLRYRESLSFSTIQRFLTEKSRTYDEQIACEDGFAVIEHHLQNFEEFYKVAQLRENAMIQNMTDLMDKNNEDKVILITGGFHKNGICDILRKRNIAYTLINPSTTKESESIPYRSLLSNYTTPLDQLISVNASTLKVASWLAVDPLLESTKRTVLLTKLKILLSTTKLHQLYMKNLEKYPLIKNDTALRQQIQSGLQTAINKVIVQAGYDEILTIAAIEINAQGLFASILLKDTQEMITVRCNQTAGESTPSPDTADHVLEYIEFETGLNAEFIDFYAYQQYKTKHFLQSILILKELMISDHDFESLALALEHANRAVSISRDEQQLLLSELADAKIVEVHGATYSLVNDDSVLFAASLLTSLLSDGRDQFSRTGTAIISTADLPPALQKYNPALSAKVSSFIVDTSVSAAVFMDTLMAVTKSLQDTGDLSLLAEKVVTQHARVEILQTAFNTDTVSLYISGISADYELPESHENIRIETPVISYPVVFKQYTPHNLEESEKDLFVLAQLGDKAAEEILCRRYERLALSCARKRYNAFTASPYQISRLELSDFVSYASYGLLKAVRYYDPSRGAKFSTYAFKVIDNEISNKIYSIPHISTYTSKKISFLIRSIAQYTKEYGQRPTLEELSAFIQAREGITIPVKNILELLEMSKARELKSFHTSSREDDDKGRFSPENLVASPSPYSMPGKAVEEKSQKDFIHYVLSFLESIDQDIIESSDLRESHTYEELGAKYNISRQRIEQRRSKALSTMRLLMEFINSTGKQAMETFGQTVSRQIRALPVQQQAIMRLTYANGLTEDQVAQRLRIESKTKLRSIKNEFIEHLKENILHTANDPRFETFLKREKEFWKIFFRGFLANQDEKIPGTLAQLLTNRTDFNIPAKAVRSILSDYTELSDFEKELIILHYIELRDEKELAVLFGISPAKLRSALSATLDKVIAAVRQGVPEYQAKLTDFTARLTAIIEQIPETKRWMSIHEFYDYFYLLRKKRLTKQQQIELVEQALVFFTPEDRQIITMILMGRHQMLLETAAQMNMLDDDFQSHVMETLKRLKIIIEYSDSLKHENIEKMRSIVYKSFKKMYIENQLVLRLADVEELPLPEIQARLNLPADTDMRKLLRRARFSLSLNVEKQVRENSNLTEIAKFDTISLNDFLRSALPLGEKIMVDVITNILIEELNVNIPPEDIKTIAGEYKSFLNEQEEETLLLRYADGLKIDQIGPIFGKEPKFITHILNAIRTRLKSVVTVRAYAAEEDRLPLQHVIVSKLNGIGLMKRTVFLDAYYYGLNLTDTANKHNISTSFVTKIKREIFAELHRALQDKKTVETLMNVHQMTIEDIITGLIRDIDEDQFSKEEPRPKDIPEIIMNMIVEKRDIHFTSQELRQMAQDAALFMDDESKEYLTLRYIDGLTSKQIAEMKGKTKHAVDYIFKEKINLFFKEFFDIYISIGPKHLSGIRLTLAEAMMEMSIPDRHAMVLFAYDNLDYEKAEELINKKITQPKARTKYLNRLKKLQALFLAKLPSEHHRLLFEDKLIALEFFLKGLKYQIPRDYFSIPDLKTAKPQPSIANKYRAQFLRNIYTKIGYKDEPSTFILLEIAAILDSLNDMKREILEFAFDKNMNIDQIAKQLDIEAKTAKSRLRFSLDAVKRAYKKYDLFTPEERSYVRALLADTLRESRFQTRSIILYRYYDDLSLKETNEVLGIPDENYDIISNELKTVSRNFMKKLDKDHVRKLFESKEHNAKNILLGYFLYSLRAEYPRSEFKIPEIHKDWVTEPVQSVKDLNKYATSGELLALYLKLNQTFSLLDMYDKNILYLYYFQGFSVAQLRRFFGESVTNRSIQEMCAKLRGSYINKLRSAKLRDFFDSNPDEFETFLKNMDTQIPFGFHDVSIEDFTNGISDDQDIILDQVRASKTKYTQKTVNELFYAFESSKLSAMNEYLATYSPVDSPVPNPLVLKQNPVFQQWRSQASDMKIVFGLMNQAGLSVQESVVLHTILLKSGFLTVYPSEQDLIVLEIDTIGFNQSVPSHNSRIRNTLLAHLQALKQIYDQQGRSFKIIFFSRSYTIDQIESFFGMPAFHYFKNGTHKFYSKEILEQFQKDSSATDLSNVFMSLLGEHNIPAANVKVFSHSSHIIDNALIMGAVCADRAGSIFDALKIFGSIHPSRADNLSIRDSDMTVSDIVTQNNPTYYAISGHELRMNKPKASHLSIENHAFIEQSL